MQLSFSQAQPRHSPAWVEMVLVAANPGRQSDRPTEILSSTNTEQDGAELGQAQP